MVKLFISDERMLLLMEWAIRNNIAESERQYLTKIGFTPTNIGNVRRGAQGFTKDQILKACELTGGNANWLFGLETKMLRKPGKDVSAILDEAVTAVKAALKTNGKR